MRAKTPPSSISRRKTRSSALKRQKRRTISNARDFRKLYAREELHAGLLIIVPQVAPDKQRELFDALLEDLRAGAAIVNEVIEIALEDGAAVITRYELPGGEANEAEGLS
ncbi:MAG: hypothetical protein AB7O39_16110 [Flavobacteriaceae bacterium]